MRTEMQQVQKRVYFGSCGLGTWGTVSSVAVEQQPPRCCFHLFLHIVTCVQLAVGLFRLRASLPSPEVDSFHPRVVYCGEEAPKGAAVISAPYPVRTALLHF
jgi:hypothetical protein